MTQKQRPQKRAGRGGATAVMLTLCFALPGRAQVPSTAPVPLTLNQAVAAALATNPAAQAAAQQLIQAQAKVGQAQAGKRFQITFNSTVSGSNARVIQPPPSQEMFGTLQNTVTIPLALGRRPGLALLQSQEQFAAAQAQYRSARLALAGQVASDYYDLLRKQALQVIAQEALTQAQLQLAATQKREHAGDVAQLDVLQAQVPVASAQASLAKAVNDAAVAQQTLNDVIGRPLDAPLSVADETAVPAASPYTLEQARTLAVRNSADVLAADASVRAERAAFEAAGLYHEPTYSLQAIDIRSNDQTSFSRQDTLQADVTLPLSDGGLGREQVREARAALAQAQAQAESARKTALMTVSTAYLTAQGARGQVAAARAARNIAQVTYDKTVRGYQNGLFPLLNVLIAQSALAQARTASVQALYDAASSANTLQAAISGITTGSGPAVSPPPSGTNGPANPGGANAAGAGGTSPAGVGGPGVSPSGTSTTGSQTGGTAAGGRGTP